MKMSQTNIAILVGLRLRSAREDAGITQGELADALGLSKSQISHFESGRNLLTLEHLKKLPKILNRPVNYFLGESANPSLSPDEDELILHYRQIPERLRSLFMETAQSYAAQKEDDQEDN